jgi:branched-chain amino acid transport system permease protein
VSAAESAYLLQQTLNALQVSAFYALVAVAYVLFHGMTGRFNLAFGALAMWAGYLMVGGLGGLLWRSALPVGVLILAVGALAVLSTGLTGAVAGRLVARPLLRHPPLAMLVATIGVAIVLEEAMRLAAGSRELWIRPLLGRPLLGIDAPGFPVQVTLMQAAVFGLCVTLALALVWLIDRRPFGRLWRACAQDLRMAELLGVDAGRVFATTMLLSSAYAGAAGALIGLYYGSASFYMGFMIGTKALFVAILGGLESVRGAFAGALLLGAFESFWSAWFPGDFRDVAVFTVLTCLLVLRPAGLFAGAARQVRPG